ncbi:MAG: hypothetical protein D6766_13450 [Verrucomicrobia bacterium]|nr:MAG: hypothetical protein D6766_13450 [Verrucomicrobiota bacterium]
MKNLFLFANGSVSPVREAPASFRMEVGLLSRAAKQMGVGAGPAPQAETRSAPGTEPARSAKGGASAAVADPSRRAAREGGSGAARRDGGSWWPWRRRSKQPRMSLADVRVVRNDLRDADLELALPAGRTGGVRAWLSARVSAVWERMNR